jgi:2'-hydroxyisoflavone reductase
MKLNVRIPQSNQWPGFLAINCQKAMASRLTFRPLGDTILDTISWDQGRPAEQERKAGLTVERERDLLRDWHNRRQV